MDGWQKMEAKRRSYLDESDKILMAALANQCTEENIHVTDLPYRLSSWALDDPDNAALWLDEFQQLVAWAVLQTPFWTIDIVCHPTFEVELYPEILAWADERARAVTNTAFGHPAWHAMVFSGQTGRILDLVKVGFACQAEVGEDSWSKVLMRRADPMPVKVLKLPEGFRVRQLAGVGEIQSYVDLHRSVFESKNMTVEWRRRTLLHPAYRPELDIVVEAPGGRLAAFCICWLNEVSGDGQVEPLGSHPDFRRLGLGRVALLEGLRQLHSLGVEKIFVETDEQRDAAMTLYTSMGFEVIKNVLVYRKDYFPG